MPYGNCIYDKRSFKLIKIDEKPTFDFKINSGVYICNKKILQYIKKNKAIDMDELIALLTKKGIKVVCMKLIILIGEILGNGTSTIL